ncbi:c-type cytochrome [Pseudooceanicola onchidii]|uniref:c-type cytochrome n=1 Tax=Pseudooceanicola onchidii TaxID=2562279 RepID=UPI0010AADE81|nr:cytochrome c [Pseudooceanicola onchidii]
MRLAALLIACAATAAQADHRLTGRDVETGAALYAENCASCHGAALEGQPDWRSPGADGVLPAPPHDVTGHTWHHDTPLLLEYTLKGGQAALEARGVTGFNSGMPAFEDALTEGQVLDILAYIRSTWPEQAQQVQSQRTHAAD